MERFGYHVPPLPTGGMNAPTRRLLLLSIQRWSRAHHRQCFCLWVNPTRCLMPVGGTLTLMGRGAPSHVHPTSLGHRGPETQLPRSMSQHSRRPLIKTHTHQRTPGIPRSTRRGQHLASWLFCPGGPTLSLLPGSFAEQDASIEPACHLSQCSRTYHSCCRLQLGCRSAPQRSFTPLSSRKLAPRSRRDRELLRTRAWAM